MRTLWSIFAGIAALSIPCAAQQLKVVKNAPFSATATTEFRQALADGNMLTRTTSGAMARDTEGRTRREEIRNNVTVVFIHDPVTGVAWVLDSGSRTARRFPLVATEVAVEPRDLASNSRVTQESAGRNSLGANVIDGIDVQGTQLTRVLASGEAGSERPIEVAVETWYSSELQIVVTSKTTDPRVGETAYKLSAIQ